jgi:hypothetical protein
LPGSGTIDIEFCDRKAHADTGVADPATLTATIAALLEGERRR